LSEPRSRIFWNPHVGPRPQRPDEGFLNYVFGKLQSIDPEDSS